MKKRPEKPVGAPPKALGVHKDQTLDANDIAHQMEENAEHLLGDLRTFAADGTFTRAEVRHARGHVLLQHKLAEDQCSILKWAWHSLMQIEVLIEAYRLKLQWARAGRPGRNIKVSQKKRAAGTAPSSVKKIGA